MAGGPRRPPPLPTPAPPPPAPPPACGQALGMGGGPGPPPPPRTAARPPAAAAGDSQVDGTREPVRGEESAIGNEWVVRLDADPAVADPLDTGHDRRVVGLDPTPVIHLDNDGPRYGQDLERASGCRTDRTLGT